MNTGQLIPVDPTSIMYQTNDGQFHLPATWLYIVTDCKNQPEINRLQNPAYAFLRFRKNENIGK